MKRTTRTALSLLTSLTLHSLGFHSLTLAETVARGPNFAAHPIKAAPMLVDAQSSPTDHSVPSEVTQGSQGAAPSAQTEAATETNTQPLGSPNIITRGPNGAAYIVN